MMSNGLDANSEEITKEEVLILRNFELRKENLEMERALFELRLTHKYNLGEDDQVEGRKIVRATKPETKEGP